MKLYEREYIVLTKRGQPVIMGTGRKRARREEQKKKIQEKGNCTFSVKSLQQVNADGQ